MGTQVGVGSLGGAEGIASFSDVITKHALTKTLGQGDLVDSERHFKQQNN